MMMTGEGDAAPATERPVVMLVEDDPAVRRSLQLLLYARGFDVRSHAAGPTLLADPMARTAACFIADYRLDELDGIETLSRLRKTGWHGPAILITAYSSADLVARARAAGFDSVIDKPFREYHLVDTVLKLVGARHVTDAS